MVQDLPRFQHNCRDCFTEGFTYKGGKRNIKTASLPDTLFKDPVIELPWQNTVTKRDNSRFIWAARSACSKNVLRRWGEDTLETIVIGEVSPFYPLLFFFFCILFLRTTAGGEARGRGRKTAADAHSCRGEIIAGNAPSSEMAQVQTEEEGGVGEGPL